ncbi:MAG: potassium-transporting ATPase subunit KdpC [Alphaproteobacteria bacterium]|nr:potassium-transporting ATPase subunit KdpC [Alphaproteobacteria bacterium]
MIKDLIITLKVTLFTILVTGLIYPFFIMGASYVFFHKKAIGSLIFDDHKNIIGSALIGQNFQNPAYFFSRPSDAGEGYDGTRSGGSNLAPTSQKLVEKIHERIEKIKALNRTPPPLELVTSSASGLDPHISSEAAYWQAPSIALKRDVSLKRIVSIIDDQILYPQLHILGNPRLNVLQLNITLDQFFGPPSEAR